MNSLIFCVFVSVMWLMITLFTITSWFNPKEVSHCMYCVVNKVQFVIAVSYFAMLI